MGIFDEKFGPLTRVPKKPGVYWFKDGDQYLYIGKTANLRRRLLEHRRAHRAEKIGRVIRQSTSLDYLVCGTEAEASVMEVRWIQLYHPKYNLANAYEFLYPFIGLHQTETGSEKSFCFTTTPGALPRFEYFGVFRSKELTGDAFFGLMDLLKYIGHVEKQRRDSVPRYSYVFRYRRLPTEWMDQIRDFLRGTSPELLPMLATHLLELRSARSRAELIEDHLKALRRFWKREIKPLNKVMALTGRSEYPVAQHERDPLFISAKFG